MTNPDQVPDLSEHEDEELSAQDLKDAAGGASRGGASLGSGPSRKLGAIGTIETAGRTGVTTDDVGDVDC